MFGGNAPIPTNTGKSSEALANVRQNIQKVVDGNLGLVVIIGVICFVMLYVVLYIYRQYNNTSLKTITMVKKPLKVPYNSLYDVSSESDLLQMNNINGKEFSYSFWMYVEGDKLGVTNSNKLVMGRMEGEDITNGSPIFAMDKASNKLYVYLKKTDKYINSINDINSSNPNVLTINYLPLQRWVNVVLVVDNNFVQLFMDGELREVKDLTHGQSDGDSSIVATPAGKLIVGTANNMPGFAGYISKVQVLNYAVTIDHAKVIYGAGPLHRSVLSVIGVPTNYGIQNPFYRIDEHSEVEKNCTV
ncbi:hypothetical protein QKU58_gp126 [Pyramimonas orientalis virus]|uniref:Uncharacterized protein n=1 Tax=Pyramimonas orientalis virus 01B TaxID=3134525 RepID=A0A7M3UNF4_9VIRU|nr:hypothetical protein QKU58_gp126 [Pyramimonas orientalis virus]QOI90205.1 hypothetical protein HWQ62_00068 [Pyramimonas orientalis virus]